MREAVIVASSRTPLAKSHRGSFNMTRPDDLAAHAIRHVLGKAPQLDSAEIEEVILGCGQPHGPQGHNIARVATLRAGLPVATAGVTANRLCNSGLQAIVQAARTPAAEWANTPLKERVRPLARFHELVTQALSELSETAALESGKTEAEARAGLLRGLEVVEFAQSLPNLDRGGALEVSRGVTCEYRREPLGIVAGIAPFNFPAMVPMWMFPIAITLGNAFILKPSEKVPLTACRLAELMLEAGYAPGLFSLLQGGRGAVEALIDHPDSESVGSVLHV